MFIKHEKKTVHFILLTTFSSFLTTQLTLYLQFMNNIEKKTNYLFQMNLDMLVQLM